MVDSFTAVTGQSARYVDIPINLWLEKAFENLAKGVDTKVGDRTAPDSAFLQLYAENFTIWFNAYRLVQVPMELLRKDYALLDEALLDRIKVAGGVDEESRVHG